MMKKQVLSLLLLAICITIQIQESKAQCTIDKQVIEVTPSTPSQTLSCDSSTDLLYKLSFEDADLNLAFTIKEGVYFIDTSKRGATLTLQKGSAVFEFTLYQVLFRAPPMFRFKDNYYSLEMQLYFTPITSSNNNDVILSVFFTYNQLPSTKTISFLEAMNPTKIDELQSVNFSDTLENDLSSITAIQETSALTYKSKQYTWLFSEKLLAVNYQQYESVLNAWNDSYLFHKYDNINALEGTCVLNKSEVRALCVNGQNLISYIALVILFFIF